MSMGVSTLASVSVTVCVVLRVIARRGGSTVRRHYRASRRGFVIAFALRRRVTHSVDPYTAATLYAAAIGAGVV